MSTRANIVFIDHELKNKTVKELEKESYCIMYCHHNGDLLGKSIKKAIQHSLKRIEDYPYVTMNIINYIVNKNRKDIENEKLLGFGISNYLNFDIEYLYIIDTINYYIHCYEVEFDDIELNKLGKKLYSIKYYTLGEPIE